jgi:glycosyltransferase involved in cell wall biosynthesis
VKIFWIHKPKAVQFVGLKNVFIGQIAALFKPKMHVINGINGLGLLFGNSTPIMKLLRFISIGFLAAVSRIHTPTFLFQNEDDQRQLRRFGISLAKSYIIPGSGVDRKIFKPTTLPSFTHQLIIGMACRLIKIKGIAEIARAMDLLHQQGVHATLRLAGDVDEMNPHSCSKEQVEALRNRPNIELHGYVEDMAAFWSKCHIAVLPSLGGEGVPMALLQPASMGRALLTTDTNGNRDICVDRSNGFLVRPGSVEALTSRIKEFSENPQLIAKMGSQSAKHIEQGGFSSESVHSMLKTVYSAVLKNLS